MATCFIDDAEFRHTMTEQFISYELVGPVPPKESSSMTTDRSAAVGFLRPRFIQIGALGTILSLPELLSARVAGRRLRRNAAARAPHPVGDAQATSPDRQ